MAAVAPVAIAATAAMAGGAAMSATNRAKAPQDRNIYTEAMQTLQAQLDAAPMIYEAEAKYQPLYNALSLRNTRDTLLGSEGNRGLLDLYESEIYPLQSRLEADATRSQRESDMSAMESYTPRLTALLRESQDPQAAAIQEELKRQALAELMAGSSLTPDERREMVQSAAAGQSISGTAQAPYALYERMMTQGSGGAARQAQRRAFAASMMNVGPESGVDMTAAIIGRPSRTPTFSGQPMLGATGATAPSGQFQLFPSYASDLYNTNYNAKAAANIANYNARQNQAQSLMGLGSSAFGAVAPYMFNKP